MKRGWSRLGYRANAATRGSGSRASGSRGSGLWRGRLASLALLSMVACDPAPRPANGPQPSPPATVAEAAASTTPASAAAATGSAQPAQKPFKHAGPPLSSEALMAHVRLLSSKQLNGRRAGTTDERAAAQYIARVLDDIGLDKVDGRRLQNFETDDVRSDNVWGLLRGTAAGAADGYVVVGAHYDHLGVVRDQLHPGAEDNASGVAVLLELTRQLMLQRDKIGRPVLIVFFGAEEVGMLGSAAFIKTPPVPVVSMHSMVNIDMIGRPLADQAALSVFKGLAGIDSRRSIGVLGTKGRPRFRSIVDGACAAAGIKAVAPEDLGARMQAVVEKMSKGRGDSYRFEAVGVPALFFSSGESDDYHKPTDTSDRIDVEILTSRAKALTAVVTALSMAPPIGARAARQMPKSPPADHLWCDIPITF